MFHRYAHLNKVTVSKGDQIKKGQLIGEVGNTGGNWTAHLHYDLAKENQGKKYTKGMSRKKVESIYANPHKFITKSIPTEWHHTGWDYLSDIGGGQLHPGIDINGKGVGNADLGNPVYSVCDGTVIYCYDGKEKNGGWGKMIIIEELTENKNSDIVLPEPVKKESITTSNDVQGSTSPVVKTSDYKVHEVLNNNLSMLKIDSVSKFVNDPIILGAVRHFLTTLGGGLVTSGYINEGELQQMVGAVLVLLGIAASMYDKMKK